MISRSKIDAARRYLLARLQQIEALPFEKGDMPLDMLNSYRYPFSRNMYSYEKKLLDLRSVLRDSMVVLDVGAGDCTAILEIQKQYSGGTYCATGISPQEITDIEYRVATASDLPFETGFFDLVISVHALSWELEQQAAIREIIRVLKPGGLALLYFTELAYSIEHRFGNGCYKEMGIEVGEVRSLSHTDMTEYQDAIIETEKAPMKHPFDNYTTAYYVKVRRALRGEAGKRSG